jgi:hypothetical protein
MEEYLKERRKTVKTQKSGLRMERWMSGNCSGRRVREFRVQEIHRYPLVSFLNPEPCTLLLAP